LINPETELDETIAEGLTRLNRWGGQTMYPFLLYIYRQYDSGDLDAKGFAEILQIIESFLVRRLFARVPPNQLNRLFMRLSQQLPEGLDLVEGTRVALSESSRRWPRDADFYKGISEYPLYTDSRPDQRRLILETLEISFKHKEHVDLSSLTVEHIMPQTLTPEWSKTLEGFGMEVYAKLLHVLGNLTLTGYNSPLSNDPFQKKRQIFQDSNLEMNKEIAKQDEWTPTQIEERGKRLAERAIKIWPGPKI
jgi:hypothetical protein